MEITPELDAPLKHEALALPAAWDEHIARGVSRWLSPPLLALTGLALIAQAIGKPGVWQWAFFYAVIVILLPVVYIAWKVRQGSISDLYMRQREQRILPMTVMLACSFVAWLAMWAGKGPRVLMVFAGAGAIQNLFLLLVTLRWKISGHSTAVASLAVFLYGLFGPAAAPVLLAIPLVGWARIRLNRHDLGQTVAGALAGAVFMLAILLLLSHTCQGGDFPCG